MKNVTTLKIFVIVNGQMAGGELENAARVEAAALIGKWLHGYQSSRKAKNALLAAARKLTKAGKEVKVTSGGDGIEYRDGDVVVSVVMQ